MKISLHWLRDHIDLGDLSPAELDEVLTFAGIEVEGIEERNAPGPADTVFDLEVTPNRPDLLSFRGIARELSALTERPLRPGREFKMPEAPPRAAAADRIRIAAPDHCPFYSALFISGVRVAPSPQWLQDKLNAIGLRPINNVVDITNFVLMETGQPLHAFDAAKINGGIVVRTAAEGERFLALDGVEYALEPGDLVIADEERAIALGGVMGGEASGVGASTTDIILESAYFSPPHIRRTARRLNLSTDSSYRFERGVDPQGVLAASSMAAGLILELAGGKAEPATLTAGKIPQPGATVDFSGSKARALLGAAIDDRTMHGILERLGLTRDAGGEGESTGWQVPSHRLDLRRPIDLVEEIARVYGLEKIPATSAAAIADFNPEDHVYDLRRRLSERLCGLGCFEIKTIKLISENQLADHLIALAPQGAAPLALKNPLSDDHTHLRPGLLPPMLEVARRNLRMGARGLRLFETGTVFYAGTRTGEEREEQHLCLLTGGETAPPSWHAARPRLADFFDLRGMIEALLPDKSITFEKIETPGLVLASKVLAGDAALGVAGQIAPARARALDAAFPVYVAELRLDFLLERMSQSGSYRELDRFPAVTRDVAMEVPAELCGAALDNFFKSLEEPLLEEARLFDVFRDASGGKLAADKKSIAYSLTYRDKNATLTTEKVDVAHGKILDALVEKLPVQLR